jgi:catechol 2,3-dioxygenase-like lactoylglutathione lyase family enzyme
MTTKINRVDHIDIIVKDVEASVAFFRSVGFTLVEDGDYNGSGVQLRFPGPGRQPFLEICPQRSLAGDIRELGLNHIALAVDDLDVAADDFSRAGLAFDNPPRVVPSTGRRLANLIDPDGRKLQFVEGE